MRASWGKIAPASSLTFMAYRCLQRHFLHLVLRRDHEPRRPRDGLQEEGGDEPEPQARWLSRWDVVWPVARVVILRFNGGGHGRGWVHSFLVSSSRSRRASGPRNSTARCSLNFPAASWTCSSK